MRLFALKFSSGGAAGFLLKPFSDAGLLAAIETALQAN